jgi:hypothetical protein
MQQRRSVWHIWRGLTGKLSRAVSRAAKELAKDVAAAVRDTVRGELVKLIRGVIDAVTGRRLKPHWCSFWRIPTAWPWARSCRGCWSIRWPTARAWPATCVPEWYLRRFHLRVSGGSNHRFEQRLERATLLWVFYHNFESAQWRSERQRQYRHPGQGALEVAGVPPGQVSYPHVWASERPRTQPYRL